MRLSRNSDPAYSRAKEGSRVREVFRDSQFHSTMTDLTGSDRMQRDNRVR